MPFQPGELVDLRFTGNPDTAIFRIECFDRPLTVANGGLEQRRKNALHPIFRLPNQPGKYAYTFVTDGHVTARGHLRVTSAEERRRPSKTREQQPDVRSEPGIVRARRLA